MVPMMYVHINWNEKFYHIQVCENKFLWSLHATLNILLSWFWQWPENPLKYGNFENAELG